MKKIICILIAISLLWLTASCGNNTEAAVSTSEKELTELTSPGIDSADPNDIGQIDETTQEEESIIPEENTRAGETIPEQETSCAEEEIQEEAEVQEVNTALTSPSLACPSVSGRLHVHGTALVDEAGNPAQLRGVSTHGIAWFPEYINSETFSQVKEWGANVMRLAMYTAESGGYCTDGDREKLLGLLDDGVQYALDADMYIILDWHILSDGNPVQYQAEAEAFFDEISARYKNYSHVLYEICNEPNGGTDWATVKAYAEDILSIIRSNDPEAVVLVGTPNWCQYLGEAAADPIEDYDNVMYTLHFYAATHKQDLRDVYVEAIASGLPVFVSEYGLCEASGGGTIDTQQADAWISLLNENNTSYVLWSLCNKDESASILDSDCNITSGFTQEDLSPVGQWLIEMLAGQREDQPEADNTETEESTGLFTATAECTQDWEEDGIPVHLYNITLKNDTAENISGWSVSIELSAEGELTDCWNGEFSASDMKITITPADWNAEISAGASSQDIGFILRGAEINRVTCEMTH